MHSPQLFPLQMFLVTATSLIAAGLVLTRRSLRLRSAGVTVAGLIALATAAARVLVGWDQPSSALVGMLIGALWALLALSTRSAATDVRTQAVAAHRCVPTTAEPRRTPRERTMTRERTMR